MEVHPGYSKDKPQSETTENSRNGYSTKKLESSFGPVDIQISRGYAREFISKVQQMRKNNAFEMMDRINIYYEGDDEIAEAIKAYEEYIMTETLAERIERVTDANFEAQDLNGHQTGMKVEKI